MKKSEKEKNFFERTGATPGPPPGGKVLLPGGAGGRAKKFLAKSNFDKIKKKFDATGKLYLEDFNNVEDMGLFLDWYNKGVTSDKEKHASGEIIEISKLLARLMTQKNIVIDTKKGDTI